MKKKLLLINRDPNEYEGLFVLIRQLFDANNEKKVCR